MYLTYKLSYTIYCCVFNLVVNYPMIIITQHNWYYKNAQFLNRMTGHYSPEGMVLLQISIELNANVKPSITVVALVYFTIFMHLLC